MPTTYSKKLFYLILFVSLFKLLIAGLVELGNDEVYYYTYALSPGWSYFDHPPMVGLLMRLTSLNMVWLNEVSLRLGPIIGCAISSYFIFRTGKVISNERTGWYAALIYNCSIYTGIIAGLFILPDSPQMPFWTAALFFMARLVFNKEEKNTWLWLLLGLVIGLATLSKVHGLYLWAGFGLFILIKKREWLLNLRMYAAFIVTLICTIPILYWNVQNKFITYQYHSERVSHHDIQWDSLLREILGEFVYQNPVIFILVVVSLLWFIKKKTVISLPCKSAWLLCMSIPMVLLFWGVALFNPTLPHWSGPAYIPFFFIGADFLAAKTGKKFPAFTNIAGSLLLISLIVAVSVIRWAPFNLGSQEKKNFGEYCPTLDLSGWKDFSDSFAVMVKKDVAEGRMKPVSPIIINKWFPGGHILFYVARKTEQQVIGIGKLDDLHQFAWLNERERKLQLGDDAYCIVPSNLPYDPVELYKEYFNFIEPPVTIEQVRGGSVVRYFYVYRMKECKMLPVSLLP